MATGSGAAVSQLPASRVSIEGILPKWNSLRSLIDVGHHTVEFRRCVLLQFFQEPDMVVVCLAE